MAFFGISLYWSMTLCDHVMHGVQDQENALMSPGPFPCVRGGLRE